MGNLTRTTTPGQLNMNKVTISVWFRVPTDTVTAVQARDASFTADIYVMDHIVPIIMFGAQQTTTIYETTTFTAECPGNVLAMPPVPFDSNLQYISGSHSAPLQQSCLGIQCFSGMPKLLVHVQPSNGVAAGSGATFLNNGTSFSCPVNPPSGFPIGAPIDVSYVFAGKEGGAVGNSNVGVGGSVATSGPFGGTPNVSLDQWHHLLISWDLHDESCNPKTQSELIANQPAANRITTTSKMYCALDDVNKSGFNLPATWVGRDGLGSPDPNLICCGEIYSWATAITFPDASPGPSFNMSYGTIPSSPLWLPGPLSLQRQTTVGSGGTTSVIANVQVDMAYLQVYAGVALDTSNVTNRRAFVNSAGKPELDYSIADALLGKSPEIRFKNGKDFKVGTNTGSLGNLTRTATINDFTPGPGL